MQILFLGNNDMAVACLERVIAMGEKVVGIVVNYGISPDDLFLRSMFACARKARISLYVPERVNHPEFISKIREMNIDLIISVAYHQILHKIVLKIPRLGAINLHPSYLPKYRGKNPLNWVLINGERETGLTIHYMDEGIDTGDILLSKKVRINVKDTADTLQKKFVKIAPLLLEKTLVLIRTGKMCPIPQKETEASYYPPRTPEDGRIHWDQASNDIYNLIRSLPLPSYPGAFTYLKNGEKLIFKRALAIRSRGKNDRQGEFGEIVRIEKGNKIIIRTGDGMIQVRRSDIEMSNGGWVKSMGEEIAIGTSFVR